MIDPVALVVVDDLRLHLLELAADQLGKQLLDVFVLRVRDVRAIVPDTAALLLAVDMTAVVGIRLVDDAVVVAEVIARSTGR